jgi:hypothetical protein
LGFLWCVFSEKSLAWWSVVFIGDFEFLACFWMAFCGQFVVVCVVNVVVWRALFRGRKIRHVFELYFFG